MEGGEQLLKIKISNKISYKNPVIQSREYSIATPAAYTSDTNEG